MPYSKLSEANIKELDGAPLTLSQTNWLAKLADKIGGKFGWPTAIKQFKKTHHKDGSNWVASDKATKEISQDVVVSKEADGRYKIVAISTAAIADQEGETFDTAAMDYEIERNKITGSYPEFRLFHNQNLGIGKVEKMSRVGIFAVDEGYSYKDAFSLGVCEHMLLNNKDGKWRNSRGFYAYEVQGRCPDCNTPIGITVKHMIAGYVCPNCQETHYGYKGVLKEIHFTKTRTFDITITDHPCVPFTGVQAFRPDQSSETLMEDMMAMNKKQLKDKLMSAGVKEADIDERLAHVTEEKLKELKLDDIPEATLLKELELITEPEPESTEEHELKDEPAGEQLFTLDPSVLESFTGIVEKVVEAKFKEMFEGLEIDIPEFKEMPELKQLHSDVLEIKQILTASTREQLKELVDEMPRAGKLRILRFKAVKPPVDEEDEDEDEADAGADESAESEPPFKKKKVAKESPNSAVIMGADGESAANMTDWMMGGSEKPHPVTRPRA